MRAVSSLLVLPIVVGGCAAGVEPDAPRAAGRGYREASARCMQQSERRLQVAVPAGAAVSAVAMPGYHDARDFGACMRQAGYVAPRADPQQYQEVARTCLGETARAGNPDAAYADCERRSRITVEVLPDEQ